MQVHVNGISMDIPGGKTVDGLLEQLDRPGGPCAVERNGELVPWRERSEAILMDGDRIEVVTLTGGG
ncbi:MAG: sulfur carrier protein ThiS [Phycisphaerales bacterium]|jgi:thiamine biosynthesis protein ThiS|nr:sulfur carrier protein ThiS [Phycisphaerales bacterium]